MVRLARDSDRHALARMRALLWPEASFEEQLIGLDHAGGSLPLVNLVAVGHGNVIGFVEAGLQSHADGCEGSQRAYEGAESSLAGIPPAPPCLRIVARKEGVFPQPPRMTVRGVDTSVSATKTYDYWLPLLSLRKYSSTAAENPGGILSVAPLFTCPPPCSSTSRRSLTSSAWRLGRTSRFKRC
jgi:hypothetical protein